MSRDTCSRNPLVQVFARLPSSHQRLTRIGDAVLDSMASEGDVSRPDRAPGEAGKEEETSRVRRARGREKFAQNRSSDSQTKGNDINAPTQRGRGIKGRPRGRGRGGKTAGDRAETNSALSATAASFVPSTPPTSPNNSVPSLNLHVSAAEKAGTVKKSFRVNLQAPLSMTTATLIALCREKLSLNP